MSRKLPELPRPQHGFGIIAGIISACVGIGLLLLFDQVADTKELGDSAFIALVVLPLTAYGLVAHSNRISKVSLPGGPTFEFLSERIAPPKTQFDSSIDAPVEGDVERGGMLHKESLAKLDALRGDIKSKENLALTLKFGRTGYYSANAIFLYLNAILSRDAQAQVIFVNESDEFVASTSGTELRDALSAASGPDFFQRIRNLSYRFTPNSSDPEFEKINIVIKGIFSAAEDEYRLREDATERAENVMGAIRLSVPDGLEQLSRLISLVRTSVKVGTTNADALQAMVDENLSAAVVVAGKRPVSIVRRDQIISKLVVDFASR